MGGSWEAALRGVGCEGGSDIGTGLELGFELEG